MTHHFELVSKSKVLKFGPNHGHLHLYLYLEVHYEMTLGTVACITLVINESYRV